MAAEPEVFAIIPMKPLADSKSRLARSLTASQRATLALGMLGRVIGAIHGASVGLVYVVGGDERVKNVARNLGAVWEGELGRNLNDTLGKAFERAFQRGMSPMYVAGDLPFIKASDIHSMLQAARRRTNIALAPARRDGGTNSILVPHGLPFKPQLGGRSFARHLSQAAKVGVSVAMFDSPGLGFDLDTPSDLEAYQQMEPGILDRLAPLARERPVFNRR